MGEQEEYLGRRRPLRRPGRCAINPLPKLASYLIRETVSMIRLNAGNCTVPELTWSLSKASLVSDRRCQIETPLKKGGRRAMPLVSRQRD